MIELACSTTRRRRRHRRQRRRLGRRREDVRPRLERLARHGRHAELRRLDIYFTAPRLGDVAALARRGHGRDGAASTPRARWAGHAATAHCARACNAISPYVRRARWAGHAATAHRARACNATPPYHDTTTWHDDTTTRRSTARDGELARARASRVRPTSASARGSVKKIIKAVFRSTKQAQARGCLRVCGATAENHCGTAAEPLRKK